MDRRHAVKELVHDGYFSRIHRAVDRDTGESVILKSCANEYPTASDFARVHNEWAILSELRSPDIIAAIALEESAGRPVLVLTDCRLPSLRDRCGQPFAMDEFFTVATRVARALQTVHAARVIHRDIKPDNILFDPHTGDLVLLDFNIAMRVGAATEDDEAETVHAGTLPYMAPEQTGRTGASIDERTDLYSAGVLFYELATGRLPFRDNGALALIHQHLTAVPPAIATLVDGVPDAVVGIIDRLLAKEPRERYQSASGLLHDVERAAGAWRAGAAGEGGFELGTRDIADRLHLPDALYGRERATAELAAAGRRAHSGEALLVCVTGVGGVGKSSVVETFMRGVAARSGLCATGKCHEYQRSIPHKPILDALRHVLRDILSRSDSEIVDFATEISRALGQTAADLEEALPELVVLIGGQPPLPAVSLTEGSERFREALRRLIQCLGRPGQPLVLFLDDLQWADPATFSALRAVVCDPEAAHLLLLAAYRDNQVDAGHGMARLLAQLADVGVPVETVALADLGPEVLTTMLADTVRASPGEVADLAALVHGKTHGNPFFVRQFMTELYRGGLLQIDRDRCRWNWDESAIAAAGITDNVVDLLLVRMRHLDPDVQEVLRWSAYLGSHCTLGSLHALLPEVPLGSLARRMLAVVRDGMMRTDPATERFLASTGARAYPKGACLEAAELGRARAIFAHDRIQQAAYALTTAEEKASYHLHAGRYLREYVNPTDSDQWLFDIVEHYQRTGALVRGTDDAERLAVAELALAAARRARSANAYHAGLRHARFAAELLPDSAWDTHYRDIVACRLLEAVCLSLTGDHDGCDALCRDLETRVRSVSEKAQLYELREQQHLNALQFVPALDLVFAQLGLFDVEFPGTEDEAGALIGPEFGAILGALGDDPGATLRALSVTDEPRHEIVTAALMAFFRIGYNARRPNTATLAALRAMSYSLRHGISRSSDYALCVSAFFMMQFFGQWETGVIVGDVASELCARNTSVVDRAFCQMALAALVTHWRGPADVAGQESMRANELAESVGDYMNIGYCLTTWEQVAFFGGANLVHVHRNIEQHLMILQRMKLNLVLPSNQAMGRGVRMLTGLAVGDLDSDAPPVPDGAPVSMQIGVEIACALYLPRPDDELVELVDGLAQVTVQLAGLPLIWSVTAASGIHCARLAQRQTGAARTGWIDRARGFLDTIRTWENGGNCNVKARVCLLEAELALCEDRHLAALQGYGKAIEQARDIGHMGDEALAAERAAALCRVLDMTDLAGHYQAQARAAYSRWGATVKVEQLDGAAPGRSKKRASTDRRGSRTGGSRPGSRSSSRSTGALSLRSLDIDSVVKASLAIAREIRLAPLLSALLRVVMENAGAERAAVLMVRDDKLAVMAETSVTGEVQVYADDPRPLEQWCDGPHSVVRYVQRSRDAEMVADASAHTRYGNDPYVRARAIKSLLCLPVVHKGELLAVLYLENRLVAGAFARGDAALLGVLTGQISTSLENARLYRDLRSALRDLASSERLKHEFLATISHELRTPLNAIINLPEVLMLALDQTPTGAETHLVGDVSVAEARDILETVQLCGRQLLDTIEQMILFSRLEAGILTLSSVPVDLDQVIAEIVASFADEMADRHIAVRVHNASPAGASVLGDAHQLGHVVGNLLSNAIKFSPDGAAVDVSTHVDDSHVELLVRDSGPGISDADQGLIFEMFRQSSAGSRRRHGGTGLGLAVTKKLVTLHGGSISVQSQVGRGCVFSVRLPGSH